MRRRPGAPLSPNEEAILRRVAFVGTAELEHTADDVRRLIAFELIQPVDGKYTLTPAGQQRLDGLPTTIDMAGHDQTAYGGAGKAMMQFYTRSKQKA
ncbi:MAG: hypothetical protein IKE60_34630 [Reyranella sp.]|uniref:hypothetical protein n=1 Tax=Reyranella sp. TaxID=1929291 RepID=UPI0025D8EE02|nr:hypothetical protein [Reyranella sp.]MBR2819858.1 hypothetical protein [Reyranella sp.]